MASHECSSIALKRVKTDLKKSVNYSAGLLKRFVRLADKSAKLLVHKTVK